jgi:kynurenine formamidase
MSLDGPLGSLEVVDLTYPLRAGIPYWPGRGFTTFKYTHLSRLETAGVATGYVEMPDHTGTHVDAP